MKTFLAQIFMAAGFFLLVTAAPTRSEMPHDPPPMPASGHGSSGNQYGAPIDGGLGILMASAALYGARRIYKGRQKEEK